MQTAAGQTSNLMGPKDASVCQVKASRTSALEVLYIRNDTNELYKFTFTQLLRPTYWVTSPNVDEILKHKLQKLLVLSTPVSMPRAMDF